MDTHYLTIVYISFFGCTLLFSILINRLFLKFATTLGIRNNDSIVVRWSSEAKPALGGLTFYIVFLFSITCYSVFFETNQFLFNKQFVGILSTSTLGFLLGLADDAYNTNPLLKFFTQLCCGILLIFSGIHIDLFSSDAWNYVITILWVVGIMNSINMLDNMDAISGSVSLSMILTALMLLFVWNRFTDIFVIMLIGMASAMIGFLVFNWHPSKIYMGDTGSQFLGAFLASIGIIFFWNPQPELECVQFSQQVLATILVFLIPIVDTTTVVINRLSKGKSPFVGGKDHTTHYLAYLGFKDPHIAIIFISISLISMVMVILSLGDYIEWGYLSIIIYSLFILITFITFFRITRIRK